MFHVPATALLLTIVVCAAIHFGLNVWAKVRRVRINRIWYLLPPLAALPLMVVLFLALQNFWSHHGRLDSGRDWPYSGDSIPSEAREVHIDANYNNRRAKFRIDSPTLLTWCEQKNAKIVRIGDEIFVHRYVFDAELHQDKVIEIAQGFTASDLWPNGGGFSIIYDSAEGIAYYRWSTH